MADPNIARSVIHGGAVLVALIWPALAGKTRRYSCRLFDVEQRKCAFGSCDKRTVDRLRNECFRAGGRP
jgi:hypothetical protein